MENLLIVADIMMDMNQLVAASVFLSVAFIFPSVVFTLCFTTDIGVVIIVALIMGLLGAGTYTLVASYKYHGLGQPVCFFMFGILMPMGTYYVLTGDFFSWKVFWISLPNAFMITGVLAGNEMRDYYEDKAADVGTLMGHFSYETGMAIYRFECIISFVILAVLLIIGYAPWPCALAFLSVYDLYVVLVNSGRAAEDKHASFMLVPLCFKLNWHFGVLLSVGYLLYWVFL